MPMVVTLHPDVRTSVQVVPSRMGLPALMVQDGVTTVMLSPAMVPGGVVCAASFARVLGEAVARWEAACRGEVDRGRSADPLGRQAREAG